MQLDASDEFVVAYFSSVANRDLMSLHRRARATASR
jgi:hypothetical protein